MNIRCSFFSNSSGRIGGHYFYEWCLSVCTSANRKPQGQGLVDLLQLARLVG